MPSAWITCCEVAFHVLATLPVVFQLVAQLTRTAIHLTLRRDMLGVHFHYLIVKECCRSCIVGTLTVGTLAFIPRFVSSTGRVRIACAITLTVFGSANLFFNVAHQLFVRVMDASGMGVPVPIFEDLRHGPTPGTAPDTPARHSSASAERPPLAASSPKEASHAMSVAPMCSKIEIACTPAQIHTTSMTVAKMRRTRAVRSPRPLDSYHAAQA